MVDVTSVTLHDGFHSIFKGHRIPLDNFGVIQFFLMVDELTSVIDEFIIFSTDS